MMPSTHVGVLAGGGGVGLGGGLGLGLGGGDGLGGLGLGTGVGGGEGEPGAGWHTPPVQMRLKQSQVEAQRLPVAQGWEQPPPPQSCTAQHTGHDG
jgi:hypothetical protein